MSIKRYEAIFDLTKKNVYSISLVEDPAMKSMFIALKKQEQKETQIKLAEVDKKERTLLGVVLIPDKDIYRKDEETGEEFYITFSKETIKESAHNFITSGYQLNSKLQHQTQIEGVSFVEQWIVKDPKMDTALAYNLDKKDIVEGAWVVKMKCDNDEIYQEALDGKINGFSIDGMFGLKEINLKSNIMAEEKEKVTFLEQLKVMFAEVGLVKKETVEVKLGSIVSGDITIQYEGDTPAAGMAVWVVQNDEHIPLPDGNYPSDLGVIVVADGVITEIQAEVEAEAAPAPAAEPNTDAAVQAIKSLLVKFSEETASTIKTLSDKMEKFEEAHVEFKKENETLKKANVELSKEPASKVIKLQAVQTKRLR